MDSQPLIYSNAVVRKTLMITGDYFLLLIDDNEWENQFMRHILSQIPGIKDFKILANGWNALNYIDICKTKNIFPDLILVDLNMSEIGGFEFIEKFERNYFDNYPNCKLFILTGSEDENDRSKALAYPSVRAFINKPLTLDKFDTYIRPYLV